MADVAVIGMPTPDGDEAPRAFVVRQVSQAGKDVKAEDIQKFVEGKVVHYKRLKGGVTFLEAVSARVPSSDLLFGVTDKQYRFQRTQAAKF